MRIRSGYIGAGSFVAEPTRVVVGTADGVQCLSVAGNPSQNWEARLGSRCVGVASGPGGMLFAACLDGFYALARDGREKWGARSLRGIVSSPVPFRDGVLIATRHAIHYKEEWLRSEWRFDFSEGLGKSVESVRIVNLFTMDAYVVCGVVEAKSGVGRVLVLYGKTGRRVWASDACPLSEVFPAGRGLFVWSQSGRGKLETRLTRLDGHEIWRKDLGGVGCVRLDGSIGLLVGPGEPSAWASWEYQQFSPGGKPERRVPARGWCLSRPVCAPDGSVFFLTVGSPPERPSGIGGDVGCSRAAQEAMFQHLLGLRLQPPVYEISLYRVPPQGGSLEVLYRAADTYSFGELRLVERCVIFADGSDVVVLEA